MQKKINKIMKMKRKGGNDEYAPNVKTTEEIENNSTIANLVQIGKLNFFTPYLVQYAISLKFSLLMNRLIFSFPSQQYTSAITPGSWATPARDR